MLRASNAGPADYVDPERSEAAKQSAGNLDEMARAVLRGDSAALRKFLDSIVPLVRTVCRGAMGRENPELEDTIQDCLIDVVRALPQFRFEAEISHYITKISLRRAITSRERARARNRRQPIMDPQALPVVPVENAIETRADHVRKLLDELNETQATVLRLRIILGHSINEIASMTGVSINTVKTRLRLGKNQLRRWLERRGEASDAG